MGQQYCRATLRSSTPPPAPWMAEPKLDEFLRLMREESIVPVKTSEELAEGAVLIRMGDDVLGADLRWAVLYDPDLPDDVLFAALSECVLEYVRVADADEGGPLAA